MLGLRLTNRMSTTPTMRAAFVHTAKLPTTISCSRLLPTPQPSHTVTRLATTSTQTRISKPTTPSAPTASIPWREYFSLRKSRKNWERAGAVIGGGTGFFGGAYYFGAVAEFDPTQQIFGMQDPTIVYALGAVAVAAGASFAGILTAGQVWRLLKKREILQALDSRDREFFHRIQRHRPKEIASIVPVPGGQGGMPDYYGEKINSVADYRSWLKKQRRFRLTRGKRSAPNV